MTNFFFVVNAEPHGIRPCVRWSRSLLGLQTSRLWNESKAPSAVVLLMVGIVVV